jgi:hypothetical protein
MSEDAGSDEPQRPDRADAEPEEPDAPEQESDNATPEGDDETLPEEVAEASQSAEQTTEPGEGEPRFLGLSERALTGVLTVGAIAIVVLAVYITARLLADQGDEVPVPKVPPNSVAPGFQPVSTTFFGPTTGLVSGWVPCQGCPGGMSGVIARTADGGRTWTVVRETERPVLSVARIDHEGLVWAGQTLCTSQAYLGCRIDYLRSLDGGLTWAPHSPPPNSAQVSPPPQPGPCQWDHPYPVSSSFPTKQRGWVLCSLKPTGMVEQYKGLYTTWNAGRGWTELPEFHPVTGGQTVNRGNMPVDGFPAGISFLNRGLGWMWTHGPDSSLSATHDGGKRWTRLWHSPDNGYVRVLSASLSSPDTGWVLRRTTAGSELLKLSVGDSGAADWEPASTWPPPVEPAA